MLRERDTDRKMRRGRTEMVPFIVKQIGSQRVREICTSEPKERVQGDKVFFVALYLVS